MCAIVREWWGGNPTLHQKSVSPLGALFLNQATAQPHQAAAHTLARVGPVRGLRLKQVIPRMKDTFFKKK